MMTHFFDSTESVAEGVGFPLFGFGHICWMIAFVIFAVLCCRLYKQSDAQKRQRMRYIFAALLLLDEAVKVVTKPIIFNRVHPEVSIVLGAVLCFQFLCCGNM